MQNYSGPRRLSGYLLAWQSRAVLLLVLPFAAIYAAVQAAEAASAKQIIFGAVVSLAFAALVYVLRAATVGAALVGALLAFCYAVTPSFPHSALWLLLATLVLTLGATKTGRKRKQSAAPQESGRRAASQVAANLGVGALCGMLINPQGSILAHTALAAALAEAAADTLASEIGQLARTPPRMLLTGERASPGTDGGVSWLGTGAALAGAAAVCIIAMRIFALPLRLGITAGSAAVFGMFFDSLLGQLFERRGWLNNDAVNFLSTLAAAALAVFAGRLVVD